MTLTFTLGAGLIIEDEGRAGARELLIAVIGCNVAWGIIDGALFLVGQLFDRGRLQRLGRAIRRTQRPSRRPSPWSRPELNPLLGDLLSPREADALYGRIADNVARRPEDGSADHARRLARRRSELRPGRDQQHSRGHSLHADRRRAPGIARFERRAGGPAVLHRLLVGALHDRQALAGRPRLSRGRHRRWSSAAIALGG